MVIHGFDITRAQLGWVCDCHFDVLTAHQFTEESTWNSGHGKWIWLAMWRSWRMAKEKHNRMKAKPGEREARGWAE